VVLEEVMNGCCNPAISGPIVENGSDDLGVLGR
jgi:hypothetical protein